MLYICIYHTYVRWYVHAYVLLDHIIFCLCLRDLILLALHSDPIVKYLHGRESAVKALSHVCLLRRSCSRIHALSITLALCPSLFEAVELLLPLGMLFSRLYIGSTETIKSTRMTTKAAAFKRFLLFCREHNSFLRQFALALRRDNKRSYTITVNRLLWQIDPLYTFLYVYALNLLLWNLLHK